MIRSRRLALVALVAAFGLASCGDPSTTAPVADKPAVIHLAGNRDASTAAGTATEAAPAAVAADSAQSKIAFMAPTDFVYSGDLPALDGPAGSWYFAAGQQPDRARIAQMAAALGVQGDVRVVPQDQGGG